MGDFFDAKKDALPSACVLNSHYTIREVIGHGGFGITYEAYDENLQISVAVKELFLRKICRRDPDGSVWVPGEYREMYEQNRTGFLNEARVLAQLNGRELPGIVRVREFFEENNTAYIVMDLLKGVTLREYVREKGGRIALSRICIMLNDAVTAVSSMHDRDIIHKDISPDNIMVTEDGEARLLDFGCAMRLSLDKRPSQLSYRRGYAAPEQYSFDGKTDKRTDVYSLGATVYYCLTGKTPPDAPEREKGRSLISPRNLGAETGPVTERVLFKAMDLRQNRRYGDAREFWDELRTSAFTLMPRTAGKKKEGRDSALHRVMIGGVCAAAAAVCFFFLYFSTGTAGSSLTENTVRSEDVQPEEAGESAAGDTVPEEAETPVSVTLREIFPGEGLYRLTAKGGSGASLHVMDDSLQEGALFDLSQGEGASRVFRIQAREKGYSIQCTGNRTGNGYWLSIMDDSPESGAWLCQRREDGSEWQYWSFFEDLHQNVYVRSAAGTWLDCRYDQEEGTPGIRLREFTGKEEQQWSLYRLADAVN